MHLICRTISVIDGPYEVWDPVVLVNPSHASAKDNRLVLVRMPDFQRLRVGIYTDDRILLNGCDFPGRVVGVGTRLDFHAHDGADVLHFEEIRNETQTDSGLIMLERFQEDEAFEN